MSTFLEQKLLKEEQERLEKEKQEDQQNNEKSLFGQKFIPPDELKDNDEAKYKFNNWWTVLQANKFNPFKERAPLFERALKYVPCAQIWIVYLEETIDKYERKCIYSSRFQQISNLFQRALYDLPQNLQIWLKYTEYLAKSKQITLTRQVFDQAIHALSIQNHEQIWQKYSDWALNCGCMETTKRVIRRYIKIYEDFKEKYALYLIDNEEYNEAAKVLWEILNDEGFVSKQGFSKFDLYMKLFDLIIQYPDITTIEKEKIIRQGIEKYTDEVGNLWIKLADYHTRKGDFDSARDVFNEALQKVATSRDFGIVFNGFVKFEEELLTFYVENEYEESIVDQQIESLERLLDKRKILINDCMLRQNINSVKDWMERVSIFEKQKDLNRVFETYSKGIESIEPENAENGNFADFWIQFALCYAKHNKMDDANTTFYQATKVEFKTIDEQTSVWKNWIELLLQKGFEKDSIAVIKQCLFGNTNKKVVNNVSLWELYIDLERSFGTFDTLRAAYQKMVDLRIITPFVLINYTQLLQENRFYEDAFKVFEAGVSLFSFPALYDIYLIYLNDFINRYEGEKIERTRDLFEKVLRIIPKNKAKIFYFMYADFEEKYGLLNHMFEIYDRMIVNVQKSDKIDAYNLYISKVAEHLGVTKTRPIFENAINNFDEEVDLVKIGLRFANLERKFGEIDRARAIYIHISQFADPRGDTLKLWTTWEDFERHHGNSDTYKEYLRIKRSVLHKFSILPPDVKRIKELVEAGEL